MPLCRFVPGVNQALLFITITQKVLNDRSSIYTAMQIKNTS